MSSLTSTTLILGSVLVFVALYTIRGSSPARNLPPGPPADPFIGHLRLLAGRDQEELFHELAQKYGDVVYLNVLGKELVVLSSEKVAKDLIEKKSIKYSGRPPFYYFSKIDWGNILAFLPYGEQFLRQRRIIQQPFMSPKIVGYRDIQEREINKLLLRLLDHPAGFVKHLHFAITAVLVGITYGHELVSESDEYIGIVESVLEVFIQFQRAAIWEFFPSIQYLPDQVQLLLAPSIANGRRLIRHMKDYPIKRVREGIASGTALPSITTRYLEEHGTGRQQQLEDYDEIKAVGNMILSAGVETSWLTLVIFIGLMALHPDTQKKAQEEIDSVVGNDRLPDFADRDMLPYINAIMEETMRWHPVVPNAVAHYSTDDDEYCGMFIPKGATIIPNLRSMSLDKYIYHDAHLFKPERFLPAPRGSGESFSSNIAFGFGRRKCPGQYLAESLVWLTIVRVLAVFDICKAKDELGKEIDVDLKFYFLGITSYPKPFVCDICSRSRKAEALVHNTQ